MTGHEFPVEAGHIMMFARAVGDPNPIYADAEYAAGTEVGGIIAPPTFVQSNAQFDPDYHLRPTIGAAWFGSGKGACDDPEWLAGRAERGTTLHAEQHFEYHRPLRAGEVLTIESDSGATWEKEGRSGKLVFTEHITRYLDPGGSPVVTAKSVTVRTENRESS